VKETLVVVGILLRIALIFLVAVLVLLVAIGLFRSIFPASTSSVPGGSGYSSAVGSAVVTAAAAPQQAAQPAASGPDALVTLLGIQWGKDWPGAIATLQQLDQLQPNSQWHAKLYAAYINAGNQQADQGNWTQARSYLNEAIRLDPTRQENTALAARFPAPTPAPINMVGKVASDVPGAPIQLGQTVTSIIDSATKPADVYAIKLPVGQTVRFNAVCLGCGLRLVAPNPAYGYAYDGCIFCERTDPTGQWSKEYTPAVAGTYYFVLVAEAPETRYVFGSEIVH